MSFYPLPYPSHKGNIDQGVFAAQQLKEAKKAGKLTEFFFAAHEINSETLEWRKKYPTLTKKITLHACRNFKNETPETQEKILKVFKAFSNDLPSHKTLEKKKLLDYIITINETFEGQFTTTTYNVNFAVLCAKIPYFYTLYNFEKKIGTATEKYVFNADNSDTRNQANSLELLITSLVYGQKHDFKNYTHLAFQELAQHASYYGCSAQFAVHVPKLARTYFSHQI